MPIDCRETPCRPFCLFCDKTATEVIEDDEGAELYVCDVHGSLTDEQFQALRKERFKTEKTELNRDEECTDTKT